MNKKLSLFVAVFITAVCLFSCGKTAEPQEKETISIDVESQEEETDSANNALGGYIDITHDGAKHVEIFYSLDYMFLVWCQYEGYVPSGIDLNLLQDEYVVIFGRTEDGNNIAFMEYYGIPEKAYVDYWNLTEEKVLNANGLSKNTISSDDNAIMKEFYSTYSVDIAFDAWFSKDTIPADQSIFINPLYKYNDPKSVFIRYEDDEMYTNRYYTINGFLIEYVGMDEFEIFTQRYAGTKYFNILHFINYFDITKEEFDAIYESENYHSVTLPYKSEYLYGTDEMKALYFERHPLIK